MAEEGAETFTSRESPWPNLNKFMLLIESSQDSYTFRCLLWNPKRKLLSTSKTSNANLRTHVQGCGVKLEAIRDLETAGHCLQITYDLPQPASLEASSPLEPACVMLTSPDSPSCYLC